ncbi:MAG: hypothetical protein COA79_04860 [Planctomycetota bacterium]|nr:MAG: hypothetical protein COA79_04860 [Planctomycetota bacterium]
MYDDWQPKKMEFEPDFDEQDEKDNFNGNVSSTEDANTNDGNDNKKGRKSQRPARNRNSKSKQYSNRTNSNNSPEIDAILKEEAYNVVGSSINVLNELGTGLTLECYEKAMLTEFKIKEIPYEENLSHEIVYKEVTVGKCDLKLVAYDKINIWIVIEDNISDHHIASMLNHLKVGKLQAGLIFNFKYPKLQWQRVITG